MTEPSAAPDLYAAPDPKTNEPMGAGEAATLADDLAAAVARKLGEVAEDIRIHLGRILKGQTRKTLIDLVLDVVQRDGLDAVDLAQVVKSARPAPPAPAAVQATAAKPGKPKGGK